MKKITQKLFFLFLILLVNVCYSQKVAIIGLNHATPDGFTFVATQDIASGEIIYFTENEYNNVTNLFVDLTEAVVSFTATSAIPKGNVVFISELGVPNTFSVSCTSGVCGTAVLSAGGPFALATDGETLFAFADTDLDPANGITTIYSAMYTGSGEAVPVVNGGNIPAIQDPTGDYPNAILVDGLPVAQPNRVEFTPTLLARTNVTKAGLENPTNYIHAQANAALSTIVFTNLSLVSPLILTSASQTNISCNGGSNGAASVNAATGGSSPYTYNWTPGNPTGDGTVSVTGLTVGTWTCTVTDNLGTTATQTFNITQPPALVASVLSQTNISCFGGSNGAASVTVSGGTPSYTYNWTPGNPTGDGTTSVTGLTNGTWTCTVTDANSCTTTQTFNITQTTALVASALSQTNISCFGGSNGAASVSVTGGTPSYTYNWTPGNPTGDGTASVTGLSVGTWTCTVTDANSCSTSQTFNITEPTAITAASGSNPTSCIFNSGVAFLTGVSGGSGSYTYDWTPGTPTGDGTTIITGLAAGNYTCIITDSNLCTITKTVTVVSHTPPTLSALSQTNVSCNGGANGAASVSVVPGTRLANINVAIEGIERGVPPLPNTYNWTPGNPIGDGSTSVTGLTAGSWTCTVTDSNGCSSFFVFTITEPAAIVVSPSSQTDVACNGGNNGAASITTPTGGTGSFTYNWTPGNPAGDGTTSVTGLTAGTWTCTVTDANSCTATQIFTITEPSTLDNTVSLAVNTLTANQAGATYQWFTCPSANISGANSQSYTPTVNGDYGVIITQGTCTVTSTCTTVLETVGFETSPVFVVYPNPSNGMINIEANFDGDFQLVNQLGQRIKEFKVNSFVINEVDFGNLSEGVYYIVGVNATKIKSQKLIIKY